MITPKDKKIVMFFFAAIALIITVLTFIFGMGFLVVTLALTPPVIGPLVLPTGIEIQKEKEFLYRTAITVIIFFFSSLLINARYIWVPVHHIPLSLMQGRYGFYSIKWTTCMVIFGIAYSIFLYGCYLIKIDSRNPDSRQSQNPPAGANQ